MLEGNRPSNILIPKDIPMKRKIVVYFSCALFILAYGFRIPAQQNLVPNPSFESYTACPSGLSQIEKCVGWYSASGTPDYFNACGTGSFSVPGNYVGNQIPAMGNAYAGIIAMFPPNSTVREYLYTKLTDTLTVGVRYYLSMKVSMAEDWGYWTDDPISPTFTTYCARYMPSNNLGMKFTKAADVNGNNGMTALMNNSSHMHSQAIISDTTNWTTISGSFVADSAYTRLAIGNFYTNAATDTLGRPYVTESYYFVDDIVVSTDSIYAVGIRKRSLDGISIYPNPLQGYIYVDFGSSLLRSSGIEILDLSGRRLYGETIEQMQASNIIKIDTKDLPRGLYFLSIYTTEGAYRKKIAIE